MSNGIKSLAKELPKYGRGGDSIVAHINPEEAALLKSMGGSGTINPTTGLPEFGGFNPIKAITNVVSAPFKAVNNIVKAIPVIGPAIDKGLVGLDKAVGSAIPGGWNTVAQTALAFTPLGLPAKVGLAALGGSGALGPNGSFNLQRALMSGAMAYGANQLTSGLQAAGGAGADATAADIASKLGVEGASTLPGSQAAMLAEQASGLGQAGLGNIAASSGYNALPVAGANTFAYNAAGEMVPANIAPQITGATTNISPNAAPSFLDKIGANDFVSQTGENIAAAGRGIQNLTGFGTGASTAATAAAAPITATGLTALGMGATGIMALDEQEKALKQQLATGSIAQAEYDQALASINSQRDYASSVVAANPFNANPDRSASIGDTYYGRGNEKDTLYGKGSNFSNLYAAGGSVDDNVGMDEGMGLAQGNMQQGLFDDMPRYAAGGMPSYDMALQGLSQPAFNEGAVGGMQQFAAGGMPQFLSGGGDGMSDSIKASIDGRQEARLADGEFVVPADVVSHLGNGSSKAGAKQLYSMMDRARVSRTGRKSQGKEINPRKVMPA